MKKSKVVLNVILAALCMLVWLPFLFMAASSLMSEGELQERFGPILAAQTGKIKPSLMPDYPTLRPFVELLLDSPGFFVMFWNSFFQTGTVLLGQAVIATAAAWAFGIYSFPGKKQLFFLYIILMILPFQVMQAANYLVLDRLHLIDTHLAVILPGIFSAFPVFIMTQFFSSIPISLLEAARLDGAGEWGIFIKIGIPMGFPGIMAAGILGFLEYYNAVEPAIAFLKTKTLWPLSLYLPNITADKVSVAWAASAVAMMPSVLLFLAGQTYLEHGIALSGVKE